MQIRSATPTDLDAIESLWREMMDFHIALDDYFTMIPEADANHRTYMAGLLENHPDRILVAEDGDQLLGVLVMQICENPPIYPHQRYLEIMDISVSAKARRQGVGRKLLEAAIEYARQQSISRVECAVALNNPERGWIPGNGRALRAGFIEDPSD